ncbi:MAG: DNA translocase FtsK 4TM domain-containing protein [Thermodesulfobacteriota bacterium]|nr:DNA translocase FtsK 4TM domain-containing protein [Thermodesulfobacteriota bacterium]
MRKEIFGILLLFVLVLTAVSLLSYHSADPSINSQTSGEVQNLFGLTGAHIAGFLIGVFGLGAFWVPVVLLIMALHVFLEAPRTVILVTLVGGVLLMATTGGLLSMGREEYVLGKQSFSSGGIVGIQLARLAEDYIGTTGGLIFLLAMWAIAFILSTRLSFLSLFRWVAILCRGALRYAKKAWIIFRERRHKAKKRTKTQQRLPKEHKAPVKIVQPVPSPGKETPVFRQEAFGFAPGDHGFRLPSLNILQGSGNDVKAGDHEALQMQSRLLEKKLSDFDVSGKVLAVSPGPVVTMYEYEPAPGVKINKIVNLTDDLALALRAESIRIVAPIPGKSVIGIEVPNQERGAVRLKDVIASEVFQRSKSKLTLALGKDIMGHAVITDLARMPHLLIAGATGSGKSVALNSMICSVLYKATPDEVKLMLVDPKRIELSAYEGIPHLIVPVVMDAKKATRGLHWAVHEMERRYALMAERGVRNLQQYNQKIIKEKEAHTGKAKTGDTVPAGAPEDESIHEKLPLVLIVIDELADLMLAASRDVEFALTRLAQMARAAGIHLLIATQRPSVDILTGIIKANFPTRISFQVSSRTDSRTILDSNGAENLLGSGDMLLLPPGTAKLQRIHGAYVSEPEIRDIIDFLKKQKKPVYQEEILETGPEGEEGHEDEYDEKYDEAVALVTETRQASISMIQRRLRVGYNRAARMIEVMESNGIVSPAEGSRPREVLVRGYNQ